MRKLLIAIAAAVAASSAHSQTVEHDATTVYALPFKSGRWVRVLMTYDDRRARHDARRLRLGTA